MVGRGGKWGTEERQRVCDGVSFVLYLHLIVGYLTREEWGTMGEEGRLQ
jgi:hypothetical protein